MNDKARYRIDIVQNGRRWSWKVWAWGTDIDGAEGSESWRPPWVAIDRLKLPNLSDLSRDKGTAKTRFQAELAARESVAFYETCLGEHDRKVAETVRIEVDGS